MDTAVEAVHDGYFSIDKRVHTPFTDEHLKKSSSKEDVETSTFNLIMREKETLLSFDTPLKFIFSHSALKEGWDNPNVFGSVSCVKWIRAATQANYRSRPTICVNSKNGERVRGFDVNT
ncbi:MAG: hypothetical protein IPL52_08145 [Flavobacteriales bacterium]|nr:hypothetical protein [Flavobacteriales bacterium]